MPGLRRPRNPRTTLGGAFAVVAVAALTAGLAQRAPVSLEVFNPPHAPGQSAPALPAQPPAPSTAPTRAAAGSTAPADGHVAPASAGSTPAAAGAAHGPSPAMGPDWIEATPPPFTPAPPPPTSQSCQYVAAGGNCPLGPSH